MEKQIPKLRFPEFEGEWEKKKLGEVAETKVTNSFSRENLNYEHGVVKNIHYGDIHTKFQTLFDITKENVPFINTEISIKRIIFDFYCKEGDLIFADASEDLNDVGKSIEITNLNNEKLLSGLHTILIRPIENKFEKGFLGHLFKSNAIRIQIKKESQGSKVLSISGGRLLNTILNFPTLPEQTKIANFLTAVDEKLTALKQKKTLLEHYKKGVLQQIFSQNIRFKDENGNDFKDWEEKKLGEVGDIITGKTPSTNNLDLWGGEIQFVTPTDISNESKYQYTSARTVKKTDKLNILPTKTIMFTCIASIGKMSISLKPSITNQQINSIIPFNKYDNEFIYYSLLNITDYIKSTPSSSTLPLINKTEFSKFTIQIPSLAEQTKIANFLSAIDEKIGLCSVQIEKMGVWKKGLLQGMFV